MDGSIGIRQGIGYENFSSMVGHLLSRAGLKAAIMPRFSRRP
jgi:hypothetical protein